MPSAEPRRIAVLRQPARDSAPLSAVVLPSRNGVISTDDLDTCKSPPPAPPPPLSLSLSTPTPPLPHTHIDKLEAAHRLPVANLRLTLSWYLLPTSHNLAFLTWTKRHFRVLTWLSRSGLLLGMLSLILPRRWSPRLVPLACVLASPSACCSYAMLSTDLVTLLIQQYEFWFFTIVNLLTWSALASLYRDLRIAFLAIAVMETELIVLLDANFRTFVPAIKTCAGAIPVLVVVSILVVLRQIDLPTPSPLSSGAPPLRLGQLAIDPTEFFTNAMLTLLLFLLRKVYHKRKLLYKRHATTRVVRCMLLRGALLLRPLTTAPSLPRSKREYGASVVLKTLGITAHKAYPGIKTGRALHARQQLSLVSLRLSTINVHKTLYPNWWRLQPTRRRHGLYLLVFYSIGILGLLFSSSSLLLPDRRTTHNHRSTLWMPMLGWGCTLVFCGGFAGAYQRDLARAMLRNFAFLFPSIQCGVACLCLADCMHWEVRCWAVASYGLWFHWILLLDALTPATRHQLGFRQRFAVPVVIAVCLGQIAVLYGILTNSPRLHDRELLQLRLNGQVLMVNTKSILLNRVLTLLVWTLRLLWQIGSASDTQLVLLRGTLEFYCPFDTFTGSVRRGGGGSLKAVVPMISGRRRGSSLVLPSNDSSNGRRATFQCVQQRVSSQLRVVPVCPQPQLPLRPPSVLHLPPLSPAVVEAMRSRVNSDVLLEKDVPFRTSARDLHAERHMENVPTAS